MRRFAPCDGLDEWRARLRWAAPAAKGREEVWRRSWPVMRASRRDMVVDVEVERNGRRLHAQPDALHGRLEYLHSSFLPPPVKMSSVTNGNVQPSMIYDSLPYYDNELEQYPILKQKVEKELAREGKPPQSLHPGVPPEPTLFAVRAQASARLESLILMCAAILHRTIPCCRLSWSASKITACCRH